MMRKGESDHRRGSYTIELSILLTAVAIVAILMGPYVRDSIRAMLKLVEIQGNSSMHDNRPF